MIPAVGSRARDPRRGFPWRLPYWDSEWPILLIIGPTSGESPHRPVSSGVRVSGQEIQFRVVVQHRQRAAPSNSHQAMAHVNLALQAAICRLRNFPSGQKSRRSDAGQYVIHSL